MKYTSVLTLLVLLPLAYGSWSEYIPNSFRAHVKEARKMINQMIESKESLSKQLDVNVKNTSPEISKAEMTEREELMQEKMDYFKKNVSEKMHEIMEMYRKRSGDMLEEIMDKVSEKLQKKNITVPEEYRQTAEGIRVKLGQVMGKFLSKFEKYMKPEDQDKMNSPEVMENKFIHKRYRFLNRMKKSMLHIAEEEEGQN